jgi:hypothetical protein
MNQRLKYFTYYTMAALGKVVNTVANFLAGAETERPMSPEYLELSVGEQRVYLVTYGAYGVLPSFDPDCLSAIVIADRLS